MFLQFSLILRKQFRGSVFLTLPPLPLPSEQLFFGILTNISVDRFITKLLLLNIFFGLAIPDMGKSYLLFLFLQHNPVRIWEEMSKENVLKEFSERHVQNPNEHLQWSFFRKKAPSQIFDWVLDMLLVLIYFLGQAT